MFCKHGFPVIFSHSIDLKWLLRLWTPKHSQCPTDSRFIFLFLGGTNIYFCNALELKWLISNIAAFVVVVRKNCSAESFVCVGLLWIETERKIKIETICAIFHSLQKKATTTNKISPHNRKFDIYFIMFANKRFLLIFWYVKDSNSHKIAMMKKIYCDFTNIWSSFSYIYICIYIGWWALQTHEDCSFR